MAHRQERRRRDLSGDGKDLIHQLVVREDPFHEPDTLGLGRIDDLTGEDHFHRSAYADKLWQIACAPRLRNKPSRYRDFAEAGPVRRIPHVASRRELEPDSNGGSVDCSNSDRLKLFKLANGALDHDVT